MYRTRDYRRSVREKVIARRLSYVKQGWSTNRERNWFPVLGRLSKYNLNCTCRMCKHSHERYAVVDRQKQKEEARQELAAYREEIEAELRELLEWFQDEQLDYSL